MIVIMKTGILPAPFDRLPKDKRTRVALAAGQALFRQGEAPEAIFLVEKGLVELIRHTEAGGEVCLFRAGPGDTLAEAALFAPVYHCTATAQVDSQVIRLESRAIRTLLQRDGDFSLDLTARLARQVQGYRRRIEIGAMRRAEDRVEAVLSDGWQGARIVDLARDTGLTPEATYRALSRLTAAGRIVRLGRGRYSIT